MISELKVIVECIVTKPESMVRKVDLEPLRDAVKCVEYRQCSSIVRCRVNECLRGLKLVEDRCDILYFLLAVIV